MADDDNTPTLPAIITRAEAKSAGLTRYFTGRPCKRGHISERLIVSKTCVDCQSLYCIENADRITEYRATWRAANRESRAREAAQWRQKNPERQRELVRAWQAANPERMRETKRNYEARKRSGGVADGRHTLADIRSIHAMQRGRCAYCKEKVGEKFHVDHITPLSKGGSNARSNIQITCPQCNMKKHACDPLEYAQSLGLLL